MAWIGGHDSLRRCFVMTFFLFFFFFDNFFFFFSFVFVATKGMEYKGILKSTDKYMNLQLEGTEEWIDGALAGNLGEVLIRCNNVLFVRAANSTKTADVQKKRRTESEEGNE